MLSFSDSTVDFKPVKPKQLLAATVSNTDECQLYFSDQAGRPKCPVDPFYIVRDKCKCVDFQVIKLQEIPESVPNGEMPRHMQLYCDR